MNTRVRFLQSKSLFAKMIMKARMQKKLTQRELALLMERSHGNIASIEGGHSIPKDDSFIISLAKALDIDSDELLRQAKNERMKHKSHSTAYPAIFSLIFNMFSIVNEKDEKDILNRFELRILLFKEDEIELAKNLIEFFKLNLKLDEIPANGLRPLNHYFISWCKEIEDW